MVVFPNCKINLGLHITRKREDGYHDLETIFYPIQVTDIIEFIKAPIFSFQSTGQPVNGNPNHNLCVKAYDLLKSRFPLLPGIKVHLHKAIPMGAGLGGGSSDAAFLLKTLNDYFFLGLVHEQLVDLSLQLGSDCPFFISNVPCIGTGRGEILEPVDLNLAGYHVVLVYPGIIVSTADAFSGIKPGIPQHSVRSNIVEPIDTWKEWMVNDFETSVFQKFPVIGKIKVQLYEAGAVYASMSGSGSACFGIFKTPVDITFPASYTVFKVPLQ